MAQAAGRCNKAWLEVPAAVITALQLCRRCNKAWLEVPAAAITALDKVLPQRALPPHTLVATLSNSAAHALVKATSKGFNHEPILSVCGLDDVVRDLPHCGIHLGNNMVKYVYTALVLNKLFYAPGPFSSVFDQATIKEYHVAVHAVVVKVSARVSFSWTVMDVLGPYPDDVGHVEGEDNRSFDVLISDVAPGP